MKNINSIGVLSCLVISLSLLTACSNDDKDIPKKNRISLFDASKSEPLKEASEVISGVPDAVTNSDWSQVWGLPFKDIGNLKAVDHLKTSKKFYIGETVDADKEVTMQPIISAGRAFFFTTDSELIAFDLEKEKELWRREVIIHDEYDDNPRGGGIAADGGYVFIATPSGILASFQAQDGKEIWRLNNKIPFSAAPTLSGGDLFVIDRDNRLQVVNARTGKSKWDYRGLPEPAAYSRVASASVLGSVLIAPFTSGEVVAISAENGKPAWSQTIVGGGLNAGGLKFNTISGEVLISDKKIFLSIPSGLTLALDGATGQTIWQQEIGSARTILSAGSVIYVLGTDAMLYALNKQDASLYWKKKLPRYQDSDEKTGNIEWTSPIMSNGKIFLFSNIGQSMIINALTGEVISTDDSAPETVIDPVIAENKLYVYDRAGYVHIYSQKD